MNLDELLEKLAACKDSREWATSQPDLQTAWKACPRGDWMIWLLRRSDVPKNDSRFRLIACDIAESVLHLVPEGEDRPRKAIETARKYVKGEATREELVSAADACAYAAADTADIVRKYFPECPEIKGV